MVTLVREASSARLVVNGRDWLVLGGELGNSNASSLDVLEQQWPKLRALGLNTVLVPIYWELLEPDEGQFDFTLLEAIVDGAKRHRLKVILLWFGAWKNSMSCYAPRWVKQDPSRFALARLPSGEPTQILSAFSNAVLQADRRAFTALLERLRGIDDDETVIMIQVENEIGMLGAAREWGDAANAAFADKIPDRLLDYLTQNRHLPASPLIERWLRAGAKQNSNWTATFGDGLTTDEIFTAYYYASYVVAMAVAAKQIHPVPLFVNAALNRPDKQPGDYPSGGPLPHLREVWKLAAPSIDLLCPDIYFSEFAEWSERYHTPDNPLFIPEAQKSGDSGAQAIYAIGALDALGFSPFAVETASEAVATSIAAAYELLRQVTPLVLRYRPLHAVTAVLLDKAQPRRDISVGDFVFHAAHDLTWEWSSGDRAADTWPCGACLIVQTSDSEFVFAGTGTIFTFSHKPEKLCKIGILAVEEGHYAGARWVLERWLNGDETHQGRHLRIPSGKWGIQRLRLYTY